MAEIVTFVQARMGSTRFHGKVLETLAPGVRLIDCLTERLFRSRAVLPEKTFILTTDHPFDDVLASAAASLGLSVLRGSEENVFLRFRQACDRWSSDYFFRVCADNPFIEPVFLDTMADYASAHPDVDYVSYADRRGRPVITTPLGVFAELVSTRAFLEMDVTGIDRLTREHVTPRFYEPGGCYHLHLIQVPETLDLEGLRLTVDTPEDLRLLRVVFEKIPSNFHIEDVIRFLRHHPELKESMAAQIERHPK